MYAAVLTMLVVAMLALAGFSVACGQGEPTRTRIRPEPAALQATVDTAVTATRAVERTREVAVSTATPVPTPTAVATPVATPEPYLAGEGDVERGLQVFLDCVAANPHARAWFADIVAADGIDTDRSRAIVGLMLSGGSLSEAVFLEAAEEEPAFKIMLALYAEMYGEDCEALVGTGDSAGGDTGDWEGGVEVQRVREAFGSLYDCLQVDPELRASFADTGPPPGLEGILEDRDLFVGLMLLAYLQDEVPDSFIDELEQGVAETCP